MSELSIVNVEQAYGNGSVWSGYTMGAVVVGSISSRIYPYMLHVRTPNFVGSSKSVEVTLKIEKKDSPSVSLLYSLLSSESNRDMYLNHVGTISNPDSLYDGSITSRLSPGINDVALKIGNVSLRPNTDYYLIVWSNQKNNNQATVRAVNEHRSILYYEPASVYIGNGSGFDAYAVYIDDGTQFNRYVPYIDNGQSWDQYG